MAADVGSGIVECVLTKGMPPDVDLISVNVPENADCERLRVTDLSYVGYGDLFKFNCFKPALAAPSTQHMLVLLRQSQH